MMTTTTMGEQNPTNIHLMRKIIATFPPKETTSIYSSCKWNVTRASGAFFSFHFIFFWWYLKTLFVSIAKCSIKPCIKNELDAPENAVTIWKKKLRKICEKTERMNYV